MTQTRSYRAECRFGSLVEDLDVDARSEAAARRRARQAFARRHSLTRGQAGFVRVSL
jgi:hypothetical protein